MTTSEYFSLTENAGTLYRDKKFIESVSCCYKIALEIENIKKQIPDLKDLNKDFVWYTVLNLFVLDDTEVARKTLKIILDSDILIKSDFEKELYEEIEFEIGKSSILQRQDNIKFCLHYFQQLNIYDEDREKKLINILEKSVKDWKEYFRIKEDISSKVMELVRSKNLSQKEIYKNIKEYDGRKILSVLKDLEREELIIREKKGNDYYISSL